MLNGTKLIAAIESSDHEDVFSDASELRQTASGPPSPIPITRVERVDDEASLFRTCWS